MTNDFPLRTWHRGTLIGSIGFVSLAAWLALWRFGAGLHGPVHYHHAQVGLPAAVLFVWAWTVMTIAMMLPTSVPLVATFATIIGARPDRPLLVGLVVIGYLAVWALVGVLFYAGSVVMQVFSWWQSQLYGSAVLLLVAGAYQFTPFKYRCLEKCRSPLSFVLGYWQGQHDRRNALRLGAHHGLFCVGCCWALMLLMFAVGVTNLGWMLVLGLVMSVEKNLPWGRKISMPLGVVLILGGLSMFTLA